MRQAEAATGWVPAALFGVEIVAIVPSRRYPQLMESQPMPQVVASIWESSV